MILKGRINSRLKFFILGENKTSILKNDAAGVTLPNVIRDALADSLDCLDSLELHINEEVDCNKAKTTCCDTELSNKSDPNVISNFQSHYFSPQLPRDTCELSGYFT